MRRAICLAVSLLCMGVMLSSCRTADKRTLNKRSSSLAASANATAADPDDIEDGSIGKPELAWSEQDLPMCMAARSGQSVYVYEKQASSQCDGKEWLSATSPASDQCVTWAARAAFRTTSLPNGDKNCPNGGVRIETFYDVNNNNEYDVPDRESPYQQSFACNGKPGTSGSSVSFVTEALKPSTLADGCPRGGFHLVAFLDKDGTPGLSAKDTIILDNTLCHMAGIAGQKGSDGKDGKTGAEGAAGRNAMIVRLPLTGVDTGVCANGGFVYETWTTTVPSDKAYKAGKNGNADYQHVAVCNGTNGAAGKNGADAIQMRWESFGANTSDCGGRPGTKLVFYQTSGKGAVPAPLPICDGLQGIQGIRGNPGPKGETGDRGAKGVTGPSGRDGRMVKLTFVSFGGVSTDANASCSGGSGVTIRQCFVESATGSCIDGTTVNNDICDGADALIVMSQPLIYGSWLVFGGCLDKNHNGKCDEGEVLLHPGSPSLPDYGPAIPQTPGANPTPPPLENPDQIACIDPPARSEILSAMPDIRQRDSTPDQEVTASNFRYALEPSLNQIDDCRNYPVVGPSRRHNCHYTAKVAYDRTIHTFQPEDSTFTEDGSETLSIERDVLLPCAAGSTTIAGTTSSTKWIGGKQLGANNASTFGKSLAVDVDGSVYVAGYTTGALDGNTLSGSSDFFVTKYSAIGNRVWTKQMGATGKITEGSGVSLDLAGNVFVAGYTRGPLDGIANTGDRDFFVTKFSASGAKQWTKLESDTTKDTIGNGVATDSAGNVLVAGDRLEGFVIDYSNINSEGNTFHSLFTKLDPRGQRVWTRDLGMVGGSTYGHAIVADPSGNAITAGHSRWLAIDGTVNATTGVQDLVVVKYDPSGNKVWGKIVGSAGAITFNGGVSTDRAGNVYAVGYTQGALNGASLTGVWDAYVVKFSPAGAILWTKQLGVATESTYAQGVTVDAAGNVFVGGYTTGSLDGSTVVPGSSLFVAKFDATGKKLWLKQLAAAQEGYTEGMALATDAAGSVFVAGNTTGSLAGATLTGRQDAFVVKFNGDGTRQ